MKNYFLLFSIIPILFVLSCGGSAEKELDGESITDAQKEMMKELSGATDEEMSEMKKKLKEMADNAKKIEAEGEESDELFSERNLELLGLTNTEQLISNDDWEKAASLREHWKLLTNEELRNLTVSDIEEIILSTGYTNIDSAKSTLNQIAESRDFIINVTMKIGMLKSTRIIDGDEIYEEEMNELGGKINERGFSHDDLKTMDDNVKISTTITEILYRLQ